MLSSAQAMRFVGLFIPFTVPCLPSLFSWHITWSRVCSSTYSLAIGAAVKGGDRAVESPDRARLEFGSSGIWKSYSPALLIATESPVHSYHGTWMCPYLAP